MFLEESEGGEGQSALFLGSDGLGGVPLATRLHLHEDERIAVPGDEVDLSMGREITADQDAEPLATEVASGFPLALPPEYPAQHGPQHVPHREDYLTPCEDQGIPRLRSMSRPSLLRAPGSLEALKKPFAGFDSTAPALLSRSSSS